MKKLNICQTLIAMGLNVLIEDGRLAEINKDDNTLNTVTAEFYNDAENADLEGGTRIVDIEGRGFVIVPKDGFSGDDAPDEGTFGLVIETKADEPGLFMHEQVVTDGEWVPIPDSDDSDD